MEAILGLFLGAIITYWVLKHVKIQNNKDKTNTQSVILMEKMRKVWKLITVEGEFAEIYHYENTKENEFIVSRQVVYHSAGKEIRTDIMLYVNGIPLVDIECKNPASFSENWFDAFKQIKEYEQKIPELYKYVQIGVGAEQIAKYFPIVPWQK